MVPNHPGDLPQRERRVWIPPMPPTATAAATATVTPLPATAAAPANTTPPAATAGTPETVTPSTTLPDGHIRSFRVQLSRTGMGIDDIDNDV